MQTQPSKSEKPDLVKTIVVNNKEALILGQLPHRGQDSSRRLIPGEIVKFVPGVNVIDTATLKTLRDNKAFDAYFTSKIPRSPAPEHDPEKVGHPFLVAEAEVPEKGQLKALSDEKAIGIIKETFSAAILSEWFDDDYRSHIRAAIEKQRKDISGLSKSAAGG